MIMKSVSLDQQYMIMKSVSLDQHIHDNEVSLDQTRSDHIHDNEVSLTRSAYT